MESVVELHNREITPAHRDDRGGLPVLAVAAGSWPGGMDAHLEDIRELAAEATTTDGEPSGAGWDGGSIAMPTDAAAKDWITGGGAIGARAEWGG